MATTETQWCLTIDVESSIEFVRFYNSCTTFTKPSWRVLCVADDSVISGFVRPQCCSFPFSLNGYINYQCIEPSAGAVDVGCYMAGRKWVTCLQPTGWNITVNCGNCIAICFWVMWLTVWWFPSFSKLLIKNIIFVFDYHERITLFKIWLSTINHTTENANFTMLSKCETCFNDTLFRLLPGGEWRNYHRKFDFEMMFKISVG